MPSKRYQQALKLVETGKSYPLPLAVELLAKFPKAKFVEAVDVAFKLGVDPKQSDQMVRGTCPLPHGTGKVVRVLVFTKPGAPFEAAQAAGAALSGTAPCAAHMAMRSTTGAPTALDTHSSSR